MLIFPIIIDVNTFECLRFYVPYKSLNLIIFVRVVKPHFVKNNSETFHIVKNCSRGIRYRCRQTTLQRPIQPFCLKLSLKLRKLNYTAMQLRWIAYFWDVFHRILISQTVSKRLASKKKRKKK